MFWQTQAKQNLQTRKLRQQHLFWLNVCIAISLRLCLAPCVASPEPTSPLSGDSSSSTSQGEPSSDQSNSSDSQAKPSTEQYHASSAQAKPSTEQYHASSAQAKPSTEQNNPSSARSKPSTEQNNPSSARAKPSTEQNNYTSAQAKPSSDQNNCSSALAKPSADPSNAPTAPSKSGPTPGEQFTVSRNVNSNSSNKRFLDVLPCLTWVDPDIDPKALILCVHGLGLNNGSYEEFGKRMAKLGYSVYAVDVPGFGSFKKAEGRDRVDFDYCLDGIAATLSLLHKVNRKLPIFVLGESMGGAIALRVTSEHPGLVDGLISSVPSGDRFKQGKETLRVGLKLLTAPNKPFNIGSDVIKRATEDEDHVINNKLRSSWTNDPLNRMELTPKELLRFQSFMNDNHDSARNIINTPVLFVQGVKDRLVRPKGTQELFNEIGSSDRQIELIYDKGHLIFEEGQFDDQVIGIVDKWLTSHIEKAKLTNK